MNSSNNGGSGGGLLGIYTDLKLDACVIQNHRVDSSGGGIAVASSMVNGINVTLTSNTASTGGDVHCLESTFTYSDKLDDVHPLPILFRLTLQASIAKNRATQPSDGGRGGILSNDSVINMTGLIAVFDNESASIGGGLYNSTGSPTYCSQSVNSEYSPLFAGNSSLNEGDWCTMLPIPQDWFYKIRRFNSILPIMLFNNKLRGQSFIKGPAASITVHQRPWEFIESPRSGFQVVERVRLSLSSYPLNEILDSWG